jgi:hypothetical protein
MTYSAVQDAIAGLANVRATQADIIFQFGLAQPRLESNFDSN